MKHILVASDLTEKSERALARSVQLSSQSGQLTLLHVIGEGLPEELRIERQRSAETFLTKRLGRLAPEQRKRCDGVVMTGTIFTSIISEAFARHAELIVIGKPAMHPYADLFTGTTAERVVRFSDRPVLMVKRPASGPYRRILAAFDGSEASVRALQTALVLAPEAEVRVVHAWWPPHCSLAEVEAARKHIADERQRVRELIRDAARRATEQSTVPAKVVIDLVENNPYLVLSNESTSCDLLVIGTHSKGRLASTASIGSLARHLLIEGPSDTLTSRP